MGITRNLLTRLQYALTSHKLGAEFAGVVGITGSFLTDASVAATGIVTITDYAKLVSGTDDSLEVAGVVFTAQTGAVTPGAGTFRAATSNGATAISLAAQINAHAAASLLVTAVADGAIVNIEAIAAGTGGNAYTFIYTDNDVNVGMTVLPATGTLSGGEDHGEAVLSQSGSQDGMGFNVVAEPGVAGAFKIYLKTALPITNLLISDLSGFASKDADAPSDTHYVDASGYSVANRYVTIRIVNKSTRAVEPLPNMIISFRISVSFDPSANPL